MADRAALFKLSSKQLGGLHGITPSFMAKPHPGLPGTSGHIHISLVDRKSGENLFTRVEEDLAAEWPDIRFLSDLGRKLYLACVQIANHSLAGVLDGLPDVSSISFLDD